MDFAAFGFDRRPFGETPDADLFAPTPGQESALAELRGAFDDGAAVAALIGEPGLGKTLTAARFVAELPSETPRLWVPAARFNRPADLYQALLFDLGQPYQGQTEEELRLATADRLLQGLAAGQRTVIVLDEAQHLFPELLEEVRLLGNLESRSAKAAFVVLVGLPLLGATLSRPVTRPLAQRLAGRPRLEPLSAEDATTCLAEHLRRCGGSPDDLIASEAMELLAGRTLGVPRLLMRATRDAFRLAALAEQSSVDAEAALGALAAMGLVADEAEDEAEARALLSHPAAEPDADAAKPAKAKRRRSA